MTRKKSTANRQTQRRRAQQQTVVPVVPTDFSLRLSKGTLFNLGTSVNISVNNEKYTSAKIKWTADVPENSTALQYILIGRSGISEIQEICGKKATRVNNRQTWTGHADGRQVYPTCNGTLHLTVWRPLRGTPRPVTQQGAPQMSDQARSAQPRRAGA